MLSSVGSSRANLIHYVPPDLSTYSQRPTRLSR